MYTASFKSYTKGAFGETTRYCSYTHSAYCTYSNNNIVNSADVALCLSAILLSALQLINVLLLAVSLVVISIIVISIIVRVCVDVDLRKLNYKPIKRQPCL